MQKFGHMVVGPGVSGFKVLNLVFVLVYRKTDSGDVMEIGCSPPYPWQVKSKQIAVTFAAFANPAPSSSSSDELIPQPLPRKHHRRSSMATAITVASGSITYTRSSFLLNHKAAAGLRSASRLTLLRSARIARDCEAPLKWAATMAGKEMRTGERSANMSTNLLVVGPGVLGSLVGRRWLQDHEGCEVVGETNTTNRHEELLSLGISPVTKDTQSGVKYPFVIFCAPPSGSEDYVAEVRAAAQRWDGKGALLFTSSSGVFDVNDNGICDENAPVTEKGKSPRVDRLLNAEEEVLKVGGNVVRLAGLYTRDRGAHTFWLSKGTVDARPDHFLNLIHYEDAADLCISIMRKMTRGQIFVGCDNTPVSRQDIMDVIVQSGKFEGNFRGFTKSDGPLGKKMNNSQTREILGWQPKYNSFGDFVSSI